MSRELGELLRESAAQPTRELDTEAVLSTARRQTLLARTGTGVVSVLAVAAVLVWPWLGLGGPGVPLEVTDQPPRSGDETPEVQIVGDPALTTSGGGWSVRISPGEDDRWCVTAVRDATEPWGGAGEPCWEIAVPAGVDHNEPVTVLGRATESGEQLLVGSADRAADERVEVTLVDGSTRTATAATFGRLPFLVWFVPLDGPMPTSVEAFSTTGSLGSADIPELAPSEIVGTLSDIEMEDLEFMADQEGISLDAAIVQYSWRYYFSVAVQKIQEAFPESYAGAEIGGIDDVWVSFTGIAPPGALEIIDEFDRQFESIGVSVEVRADGTITEEQLAEAIESVHRSVFARPEVTDASTSYDRQAGQITTLVNLAEGAPSTAIEELHRVATASLEDALDQDVADTLTISVQRSYQPLGGTDDSE